MACVHLARCTLEQHREAHADLPAFRGGQDGSYEGRVLEALCVAGDALASAYPMLERIAQALDARKMLKPRTVERSEPNPARSPAAPRAQRAG
jgi:hypothetical protein